MGVVPRKTVEYRAITRPRIEGSAESWSRALAPAAKATLAAPTGTSRMAATSSVGAAATSAALTPNATDAKTR